MRTLRGRKKKQRLTFRENCPKRDTILLQEEKRKKNNVNKSCKDDERTAKEGTNTNHRLTQPCCCGEQQELHMCKQSMVSIGRQRLVKSYFCTISVLIHFSLFFLSK